MNILPKKRWHVRTRENIARVRKDEAEAAEQEREKERRIQLAEQEARTNLLREKARSVYDGRDSNVENKKIEDKDEIGKLEHVNFFKDLEEGNVAFTGANKDYENEKKQEKEKYEKQIGYLTYLGQDTVESTGNISWFNKVPNRGGQLEGSAAVETNTKTKQLLDPLNSIRKYLNLDLSGKGKETEKGQLKTLQKVELSKSNCFKRERDDSEAISIEGINKVSHTHKRCKSSQTTKKQKPRDRKHKKKCKKRKSTDSCIASSDSDSSDEEAVSKQKSEVDKLRAERLKREAEEKIRAAKHLALLSGKPLPEEKKVEIPVVKQKYSSQFNPHLAKQNFEDHRRNEFNRNR